MTNATSIWPIIATVASLFMGIVGALVLLNLESIKNDVDSVKAEQKDQRRKIENLVERKNICHQDFVDKVAYIRSTNNLEMDIKSLIKTVSELIGSNKVLEKMPDIFAAAIREVKSNG